MIITALFVILPALLVTRYSFPAQDDFDYVLWLNKILDQGYGIIGMAAYQTADYYTWDGGLYTSTFFSYLTYGIVGIDPLKIQIAEFILISFFFTTFAVYVFALTKHIFRLSAKEAATIYAMLVLFLYGVVTYPDFDVFYWICSSLVYLLPLSFGLLGIGFYLFGAYAKSKRSRIIMLSVSGLLGFLAAGATLGICALNLWLYILTAFVIFLRKEKRSFCFMPIVPFVGSLVNGLSPGYYVRAGESKSMTDIIIAAKSSFRFVVERSDSYMRMPEFWMVLTVCVLLTAFIPRKKHLLGFNIKFPMVFAAISYISVMGIIFPMMLAYGYGVFLVLIRGQVVLDFSFFNLLIINILLIEQWLWNKYGENAILKIKKDLFIVSALFLCLMALQLKLNTERMVGLHSEYCDLISGAYKNYTDYYLNVLDRIKNSEGDIAVIYVDNEVLDTTNQINPLICYDVIYEPDDPMSYNNCMAHYYGKKAVWVLHSDYSPTDEDYAIAQKCGVSLR